MFSNCFSNHCFVWNIWKLWLSCKIHSTNWHFLVWNTTPYKEKLFYYACVLLSKIMSMAQFWGVPSTLFVWKQNLHSLQVHTSNNPVNTWYIHNHSNTQHCTQTPHSCFFVGILCFIQLTIGNWRNNFSHFGDVCNLQIGTNHYTTAGWAGAQIAPSRNIE